MTNIFNDRVAVITGASGGIGLATAQLLRAQGARLLLTDLNQDALVRARATFHDHDDDVVACTHDVTRLDHAEQLAEFAAGKFGQIDYLITAAGMLRTSSLYEMTAADWRNMIEVNVDGVFHSCRALIPLMRLQGAIVAVSSLSAHTGRADAAHYAAAKGAVVSFMKSLSVELAPRIRVNAVSPGLIETPLVGAVAENPTYRRLIESIPMERLGKPDEVAGAISFLCSSAAAYITGQVLHVNGGLYG